MILIYSREITPRLKYTLNYIFRDFFNVKYNLINNKDEFIAASSPKINYSPEQIPGTINIKPHKLLFEKGIKDFTPVYKKKNDNHYLFHTFEEGYDLEFDIFSAVFYLISRYEEYHHPYNFRHSDSIAFNYGFLTVPVVNIWLSELKNILNKKYKLNLSLPEYKHISTIDIDNAFAFKHKGIIRYLLATGRSMLRRDTEDLSTRIKVLQAKAKDPYDTYDFIKNIHNQYDKTPIFFILLADYGKYDKNLNYKNKHYQKLIIELAKYAKIGIHPGYASNFNNEKLIEEISRLKNILNREISYSRQHFLMLNLPNTYRNLINLGIKEDYTMGYSSFPGYRAGTSVPFYFYDLEADRETNLKIFPFQVMDVSLNRYLNFSPEEAIEFSLKIINLTKKYGGTFISAWHNESLSEFRNWKGWRKVFEQILKNA
jgi:hypothetical protein